MSFQDFECYLIAVMRHPTLTYHYLWKGITSPKLMLAWILRKKGGCCRLKSSCAAALFGLLIRCRRLAVAVSHLVLSRRFSSS